MLTTTQADFEITFTTYLLTYTSKEGIPTTAIYWLHKQGGHTRICNLFARSAATSLVAGCTHLRLASFYEVGITLYVTPLRGVCASAQAAIPAPSTPPSHLSAAQTVILPASLLLTILKISLFTNTNKCMQIPTMIETKCAYHRGSNK